MAKHTLKILPYEHSITTVCMKGLIPSAIMMLSVRKSIYDSPLSENLVWCFLFISGWEFWLTSSIPVLIKSYLLCGSVSLGHHFCMSVEDRDGISSYRGSHLLHDTNQFLLERFPSFFFSETKNLIHNIYWNNCMVCQDTRKTFEGREW